jgi:hypothetical protein
MEHWALSALIGAFLRLSIYPAPLPTKLQIRIDAKLIAGR